MPDFWFFLTSTALFDSLSTAIQIVIFVFLFSTRRPIATSAAFLSGLSLAYWGCGVLFLWQMEAFNRLIAQLVPSLSGISDPQYYWLQLVFGVLCTAGSGWFAFRKKRRPSIWLERLKRFSVLLNPFTAALLGVVFSVTSFPAAVPYLGALEKLAQAYGPAGALPGTLYYNFIYIVPLLVPFALYLFFRKQTQGLEKKLDHHSRQWTSWLNLGLTAFLGLLFFADSVVFLCTGHPLLASKYF